jgi:ABC-2 family transporter
MSELLYKAWLETRVRFLAGLAAVSIVCIYCMGQHAGLVRMWSWDLQHPRFSNSMWAWVGIHEYGWYLWHYLYDESLQQICVLFAVLLAFDGLIHEKTSGTVLFSLGLPVSRKRWLFTRLGVVLIESAALSLFAALVVIIGSSVIHQTFSLSQVLLHVALIVAAGVYIIALANLCYTLFPGNYLSLPVTLVLLGVPYLWLQLHMQRMRIAGRQSWLGYLDLPHAMAGPWQLDWAAIPWISLLVIWMLTALVLGVTVAYGDRVDY